MKCCTKQVIGNIRPCVEVATITMHNECARQAVCVDVLTVSPVQLLAADLTCHHAIVLIYWGMCLACLSQPLQLWALVLSLCQLLTI